MVWEAWVSYSCIRCPKVVKVRVLSVLMLYGVGGLGVSRTCVL